MANQITESTLEMHYHKALMDAFRACYGIGPKGDFSFYKYSQQKEKFVGFDQAYVKTELDDSDFYEDIKSVATGKPSNVVYAGYFLQFKVVEEKSNRLKSIPSDITKTPPFYGVKLSTRRDSKDNLSQHELLRNIQKSSAKALVYYACPMLFDKTDLYVNEADLNFLRLVDIESSGSDFNDNKTHHIYFKNQTAQPVWCSEPVDGKALTAREFFEKVRDANLTPKDRAEILKTIIDSQKERILKEKEEAIKLSDVFKAMADFFYLISYKA